MLFPKLTETRQVLHTENKDSINETIVQIKTTTDSWSSNGPNVKPPITAIHLMPGVNLEDILSKHIEKAGKRVETSLPFMNRDDIQKSETHESPATSCFKTQKHCLELVQVWGQRDTQTKKSNFPKFRL